MDMLELDGLAKEIEELALRLRNERDLNKTLSLAVSAWSGILELALEHGWNPMGASLPGRLELELSMDSYFPLEIFGWYADDPLDRDRRVLLEDALNLADALEAAFREYEPVRMPASYFQFEPADRALRTRPSIGALSAVIDFCQMGSFQIETHRAQSQRLSQTLPSLYF